MNLNKHALEFIRFANEDHMTTLMLTLAEDYPDVLNEIADKLKEAAEEAMRVQHDQLSSAVFGIFNLDRGPQADIQQSRFPFERAAVIRYNGRPIVLDVEAQHELLQQSAKINAIKVFRRATSAGLKEAKDCIEFLGENGFIPRALAGGEHVYSHRGISCVEMPDTGL